jgi:OmpA-OmpF porin, OOP family
MTFKISGLLATTATLLALSAPAMAEGFDYEGTRTEGYYVGLSAGITNQRTGKVSGTSNDEVRYDVGPAAAVTGGYAFGNGLRLEEEFSYRNAGISSVTSPTGTHDGSGDVSNYGFMTNLLFDIPTGTEWTPYVGAGVGLAIADASNVTGNGLPYTLNSSEVQFAYQAIAGLAYDLDYATSLTFDYRLFGTDEPRYHVVNGGSAGTLNQSHNFMFGVRYNFGNPPVPKAKPMAAAPMVAPVAPPMAPVVGQPRAAQVAPTYMVFFDFDKSTLSPEAKRVLQTVAQDIRLGRRATIQVTGHTDTSGSPAYNERLSVRRANAVKNELIRLGVSANDVMASGAGERDLMIPTADKVREPQNRRATVVFK